MHPRRPAALRAYGLIAAALVLLAACGETSPPAPRDKASLAPYVASPEMIVEEMLRMAGVGPSDTIYDLGSGDGRIVIMAAQIHGARGIGFELEADLVRLSTENARRAGVAHLVEFRRQDVLTVDLSPATVVTLYLGQPEHLLDDHFGRRHKRSQRCGISGGWRGRVAACAKQHQAGHEQ